MEHLDILNRGVEFWNQWRKEHPEDEVSFAREYLTGTDLSNADLTGVYLNDARLLRVNLRGADLSEAMGTGTTFIDADLTGANLSRSIFTDANFTNVSLIDANLSGAILMGAKLIGTNLSNVNLSNANLSNVILNGAKLVGADLSEGIFIGAHLTDADLSGANLTGAHLNGASLNGANLSGANLSGANLSRVNLTLANLTNANLTNATLTRASLVRTNLSKATITNCKIFGISAWGLKLEQTEQEKLIITADDEPTITVDDLEVAQFIYLLLNNAKIRNIIETVAKKAVLILGRFTPERKIVLDALHHNLRQRGYLPIIFDFDKPSSRNLTETVSTLAHISRFIIADITEAKSIPQELQRIIPALPSVPVQPLLHASYTEYAMFRDFFDYHTVLPPRRYDNPEDLLSSLEETVIMPAETRAREIEDRRKAFERENG